MTNNTDTLNGALRELGETMAANLTTQGVPSTYDEGLTTLASKILQIGPTPPTPTPASITLTADKSILSYADTESAVLTATVLDSSSNPVEGVSVDLYKDSVLWDTLTTGSAGTVSKTYTSAGIGDVGFTAECGSLVTETYSIRDAIYYHESEFTSTTTLSLTAIPTNFVATFKLYKPTNYGTAWMEIGSDASNNIFGGCVGGAGILGTYVRVNGNYACTDYKQSVFGNSTTSDVEFKCENGVTTTKANNQTTTCNYAITTRSYQKIALVDGAKISNLLIMPL